ncbi:hypothetical protein SDJN02_09343, partial [Cucurbita argyrosperma subsp. argyrosperma]
MVDLKTLQSPREHARYLRTQQIKAPPLLGFILGVQRNGHRIPVDGALRGDDAIHHSSRRPKCVISFAPFLGLAESKLETVVIF